MKGTCLVVMYHYVRDTRATPFPGIRALHPDQFTSQLDWLQRRYQILRADEFEAAVDNNTSLPDDAAVLTFDDGFVDHFEVVYSILTNRGLSGMFFLSGAPMASPPRVLGVHKTHFLLARLGADALVRAVIEERGRGADEAQNESVIGNDSWEHADERTVKTLLNYEIPIDDSIRVLDALFRRHLGDEASFARQLYLSADQVREMASGGMVFGYHTNTHPMLSRLTPSEQREELVDGVSMVQCLTGQVRVPFCYPWGGPGTYTSDTLSLLEHTGYSLAFTTTRRRAAIGVDGRFELPRIDTRDLPPHTAVERVNVSEVEADGHSSW